MLIDNNTPAMWPEEFELVVKTLLQRRPQTYLEWGGGISSQFYPLLASVHATIIDNFPPWCNKIAALPVVKCSNKITLFCNVLKREDNTHIPLKQWGTPSDVKDSRRAYEEYTAAVDRVQHTHYDAVLIDGRFRLGSVLKILKYISPQSVVFVHDFTLRPHYSKALLYYDIIGYARSLVVLRMKQKYYNVGVNFSNIIDTTFDSI